MKPRIPTTTHRLLQGRQSLRFAILLVLFVVLAVFTLGAFDAFFGSGTGSDTKPIALEPIEVPIPPVDRQLLATVKEETSVQRYSAEAAPYEHLLRCATYIVPGTLQAMGMADEPVPIDEVRQNPKRFRGRPLAYEGELIDLQPPVAIPGMPRFKKTEGLLLSGGQPVFFAVISDVPPELRTPGTSVRIEGLFFKLRDFQFPTERKLVPHVVGFELRPAFGEFAAITKLDPKILATIHDEKDEPGEIEPMPLYHIASYVRNRPADGEWKKGLGELSYQEAKSIVNGLGEVPRGKEYRILGSLYDVQIKLAEANPLGVRYWTRAWIHHPDAQTIELHIPGRLAGAWRTGDFVVFYGVYMKRHWYEAGLDQHNQRVEKVVPLFVADTLYHWELLDNPADFYVKASLATVALLLIGLVCFLVIRDSKADQEVRQRILDRRQRRRERLRAR